MIWPLLSATVPCVSAVGMTELTVSVWADSFAGPVLSFEVRSDAGNVIEESSLTVFASFAAAGASFTSRTLIVTVAVFDVCVPSVTL